MILSCFVPGGAVDVLVVHVASIGMIEVDAFGARCDAGEGMRYTGTPHLVVEILSSDPARDIIRKSAKYAAAGLERYWIIDPDGPEVIVYRLADGVLVEKSRHGPGIGATFDIGPTHVTFDPADLVD